jgi:outer membrane protein assembly factor BamB
VKETPFPQEPRAHTFPTQPIPQYDELVPHHVLDPEHYNGVIAPNGKPYIVPPVDAQPYYPYTDDSFVAVVGLSGIRWNTPAFDPTTEMEYACTNYTSLAMKAPPAVDQHPVITNVGAIIQWQISTPTDATSYARVVAFKPGTGKVVWRFDESTTGGIAAGNATQCDSSVTATAGGLVLIGRVVATKDFPNGGAFIQAIDSASGKFLWQIPVLLNGRAVPSSPRLSTYSVGGKQYLVSFMHSAVFGADVTAFALP